MNSKPISVGVWVFGMCSDRYVGNGYKPYIDFLERIDKISDLQHVKGIEVTFPGDVNKNNINIVKDKLKEKNLVISCMGVELVCDKQWKTGAFTSPNAEIRNYAIKITKEAMDLAKELGVKVINLWLGQDGFDYVFECNYVDAWKNLIQCLQECADHCPDIKLGIEYKVSEPRLNCMANSGGKALAIAMATGRKNIGVTLDVGHAFNAGENPAEIASVLMYQEKLYHLHLNDNYKIADDDMPVGSVHWPQYIELFYWLNKLGYDGWYSLDMYPYRDDPSDACEASISFINGAMNFVEDKLKNYEDVISKASSPSKILSDLYKRMFNM